MAFHPNGDGSCQFAAVAFLLKNIGIFRSADTLRREIVKYLTEHRNAADGTPQELFAAVPWDEYISGISLSSTFGDQLTLQAVAILYQVQFLVISTIGQDDQATVSPEHSEPVAQLALGHFAETPGLHYVALFPVEPSVEFVVHDMRGEGVDNRDMGMEDGDVGVEDSDVGVNDGHVDDGHMGDGHVVDGQMGVHDGHVDDGFVGDGHVGDNHKGDIHLGDGHKCDGHMGVGERHGPSWGHKTKLEELPDR